MEPLIPGLHALDELLYYQDPANAASFFYIPGAPLPVLNPQERPLLSLLMTRSGAFLQLDVCWQPSAVTFQALRQAICKQYPTLHAAQLRLTFAPLVVERITLLLAKSGEAREMEAQQERESTLLATADVAAEPPFHGFFSVALSGNEQALVLAALRGAAGILQVRYVATAALPPLDQGTVPPSSAIHRTADIGSWFADGGGEEQIRVVG